jgi:hypothetical protein
MAKAVLILRCPMSEPFKLRSYIGGYLSRLMPETIPRLMQSLLEC